LDWVWLNSIKKDVMKYLAIGLMGLAVGIVSSTPASACSQHDIHPCSSVRAADHYAHSGRHAPAPRYATSTQRHAARANNTRYAGRDGRPGRWCGWYMRQRKGVADRRYNLAHNWSRWGSPTKPRAGAVVVWRSHVGEIVSYDGGCKAVVHSGNDGGAVRTRERNICNAIAFRA